jgi:hypothetical protein
VNDRLAQIERDHDDRLLSKLKSLEAEREDLLLVIMYPTMHPADERARAEHRLRELADEILVEETKVASLTGRGLAAQQSEDSQQMLDATRRTAEATEATAHWAKVAAIGAIASVIAAIVQFLFRR